MQDDLLIRRAQTGDAGAFEALIAPYEKRVFSLCLRVVGEREEALDCAQEAMLRAWRGIGQYRRRASFQTWVLRIATNACLDALRRRQSRPAASLDALLDSGFEPPAKQGDPEAETLSGARKDAVARALTQLSDELRTALVLRDIQGLSYEETAAILDVPLGTVKSRINRAREKLRGLLLSEGELFSPPRVHAEERRNA